MAVCGAVGGHTILINKSGNKITQPRLLLQEARQIQQLYPCTMFSWWGKSAKKDDVTKTIVDLRAHLTVLEKRASYAEEQRDEHERTARALVTTNKAGARNALRKKKQKEDEIDKIQNQILALEQQLSSIEFANMNRETMKHMKQGAGAMRVINKDVDIDKLEETMDDIRDQVALNDEMSAAISQPLQQMDDAELEADLDELEQEELDDRMTKAAPAPSTSLPDVPKQKITHKAPVEDEEEALRQLEAEMAV